MFERASRMKLRFDSEKGKLSTEDLWDLPLTTRNGMNLDTIAKTVNKALKEEGEESFVEKKSNKSSILELKLNILKHIIQYKLDLAEKKENAMLEKANQEKIMGIIAEKEDEALKGKSIDELKSMLKK